MTRPNIQIVEHEEIIEPRASSRPVDFVHLIRILRARFKLILAITLLSLTGMYLYVSHVAPVYSASSQVIMDTRNQNALPGATPTAGLNLNSSIVAGEVQLISSNVLIGEIVDKLDILSKPEFASLVEEASNVTLPSSGSGAPVPLPASPSERILRAKVIEAIQDKLAVTEIGVSYAIEIKFNSHSPFIAAAVANALAEQYISNQVADKKAAAVRSNSWLSDRIIEMSKQVEDADQAVVEFRSKMTEDAGGSEEAANKLLQELNTKLVAAHATRADAEVRYEQVQQIYTSSGLAAVASIVTSPLLQTLQKQLADDLAKQAQMASTLGKNHPDMVSIAAQIADVQKGIDNELLSRIDAMKNEVTVAKSGEDAIQQQINKVSDRLNILSHASVKLDELSRTAAATRLVYENFLSRFKETDARDSFQTADARVIGVAQIPTHPSSPRKGLLMAIAGVLGLSLGIAIVFIRNLVVAPIATSDDLIELTNRPALAMLPHISSETLKLPGLGAGTENANALTLRAGLGALKSKFLEVPNRRAWLENEIKGERASPFMEGIRSIRTKLFNVPRLQRPRVIMVTSSLAGEGKSTICFALAHVLKTSETSVVLLDADLRRSDTVSTLRMPDSTPCLIEFLEGKRSVKGLPSHSEMLGVDVVVPMRTVRNAADLIASPTFSGMVTQLSARYDVVIINAPPVLDLSDSLLLAKYADATIFAVQSGRTPTKIASQSLARLHAAGAMVVGTVMTQVRRGDVASQEVYGSSYFSYYE